jgi:hypothetical protein
MQNETKLYAIFMAIFCIITISSADIGIGISDIGTISSITGIEETNTAPVGYMLQQNYPNPFNPGTEISFSLAKSSFVTLEIYNSLGQKVATLINNEMNSGSHKIKFNASDLSSGVYYYKIDAGEFQAVKKMLVLQ